MQLPSRSEPATPAGLFVAWTRFQRRPLALCETFDLRLELLPIPEVPRPLKLPLYLLQSVRTLRLLARMRPQTVWVQLPQSPLLGAAARYACSCRPRPRIVADCHNPAFAPPWSSWPGMRRLWSEADLVLVHHSAVVSSAIRAGVPPHRIRVLEDAPAAFPEVSTALAPGPPSVLFMTGFLGDEPLAELLAAAELAPEIEFVVTGDPRRARGRHDLRRRPRNVVLTGFLAREELDRRILGAHAILALTRNADEQSSSAAEGLGAGRPLVLSDTPVLREMYPRGSVFVDARNPRSIVAGCREAVARGQGLAAEACELRAERCERWARAASELRDELTRMRS